MPKTPLEQYQALLQHQFKFTAEELAVNRQGNMAESQLVNLDKIRKEGLSLIRLKFLSPALLIGLVLITYCEALEVIVRGVLVMFVIGLVIVFLLTWLLNRATRPDILESKALSLTGPIWVYKQGDAYTLSLESRNFTVNLLSQEFYRMLQEVEGEIWRVYYTPNGRLLSLEVVELHPNSIWREIE